MDTYTFSFEPLIVIAIYSFWLLAICFIVSTVANFEAPRPTRKRRTRTQDDSMIGF